MDRRQAKTDLERIAPYARLWLVISIVLYGAIGMVAYWLADADGLRKQTPNETSVTWPGTEREANENY